MISTPYSVSNPLQLGDGHFGLERHRLSRQVVTFGTPATDLFIDPASGTGKRIQRRRGS